MESNLLHPYIRLLNATGVDGLDFYIFNSLKSFKTPNGQISQYHKCDRGLTTLRVCLGGNGDEYLASMALNLEIGDVYTVCAIRRGDRVSLYAIREITEKKNMEYGHLRVCNLMASKANMSASAKGECFVSGMKYIDITKYIEMKPDNYEFTVSFENEKLSAKSDECSVKSGKYNTLYVFPSAENENNPSFLYTIDAMSYTGFYL